MLRRTQAGPGRTVKQEQEEISRNHEPRLFLSSVMKKVQNDKYYENVRKNTGSSRWMDQDLLADTALGAIDVVTDVC